MEFEINWTLEPKVADEWRIYIDRQFRFWFAGFGPDGERRWVKYDGDAMTFPNMESALEMRDAIDVSDACMCTITKKS